MKIVFCIPGREFSGHFLKSWSKLINELQSMEIEWELINEYHPIVYTARRECLEKAPGCKVVDETKDGGYITPAESSGDFLTYISFVFCYLQNIHIYVFLVCLFFQTYQDFYT